MALKKGKVLNTIPGISPDILQNLGSYWITTAEELLSAAVLEGGIAGLASITGLAQGQVIELVTRVQSAMPIKVSFSPGNIQRHGLGALDISEQGKNLAGATIAAPLPPAIDLHNRFGPVRDQGMRGTCVAFACSAMREFWTGQQSSISDFSEQFLYWDCKQHDLVPGEGTFIRVALNRLEFDGIPNETDWPYNPTPIPGNEGQAPPPPGIMAKANPNRIQTSGGLSPTNVDDLRQSLANNSPVTFAVPVYTSWFTEPTSTTGDVRLPLPGEHIEGGHAICMAGYQVDAEVPGGGYFLVRNSWGTGWASQNPLAPGYARIPFAYLSQHGTSAYTITPGLPPVNKSFWQVLLDWLRDLFG